MSTTPTTMIPVLTYAADELDGIVRRNESVNIDRLAATVANLLARADHTQERQAAATKPQTQAQAQATGTSSTTKKA